MKFQDLKIQECPSCGCSTVVAESVDVDNYTKGEPRIREHTMGGRWERRTFLCGCEVGWCPNFRTAEVKTPCPKDPQIVQMRERLENARAAEAEARKKAQDVSDAIYNYRKNITL